jgi:hypothetical protein
MCATIIEPHPALLGPFEILLLSIAIFPLILRRHWERHYQKLCALLAATTCGYYFFALHGAARVQHAAGEHATFIVVVGTFFVVAGAIHLHIPRPASPLANVVFLFGGSVLANFIGTIGAAIAESRHVPAPGFLAYIIKYACPSWFRSWRWSVSFSSAADYLRARACRLTMTLQCLPV